jgi:hypothetical protein
VSDMAPLGTKYTYGLLCAELGREKTHQIMVAKLRAFADAIEKNGDPTIYTCEIENIHPTVCEQNFIESLKITLSHPWPG